MENLAFSYDGRTPILTDIHMQVQKGEMLAIVGKNGAGKSTLSNLICGFLKPGQGRILFGGEDIADWSIKERGEKIGLVMQNPNQMISKPMIYDEVALGLAVRGVPEEEIKERVYATLKICGIYQFRNWPVSALSFGQKKRVTIASILVLHPQVLILDEPTAGQDYRHYTEIMEFLKKLNEEYGITIIMITHDLGIVASMCEKIAVMYAGRIVEYGTTDEIFYEPKHEYTKGLLRSIPKLDAKEHEKLVPIEGTPIDLLNPPKGCPFAPRCNNCMKICLREMPPVTTFGDVHYTQCWMNQKAQMEGGETGER